MSANRCSGKHGCNRNRFRAQYAVGGIQLCDIVPTTNAVYTIDRSFNESTDKDGKKTYTAGDGYDSEGEAITTASTTEHTTTTTTTTVTTPKIILPIATRRWLSDTSDYSTETLTVTDEETGEESEVNSISNNISAYLYDSGLLRIYGYGRMSDYSSCPFGDSIEKVTAVEFMDASPRDDSDETPEYVIENIGAHLLDGAVNLKTVSFNGVQYEDGVVVIPDTITSIGEYAFQNCEGITSVTVPDSVTTIGRAALSNCTAIQSVILPRADCVMDGETPLTIAAGLFNYENGIAEMDGFDKTGEHMGAFSYYVPYSLKTITILGGETIPVNSFVNMPHLETVSLPNTITTIGANAFSGCTALKLDKLPANLVTIDNNAFQSCKEMTAGNLSDSIKTIGDYAFDGCEKAAFGDLTMPSRLTQIGQYAFRNCKGITSVTILDSVSTIGSYAFKGCTSLISFDGGTKQDLKIGREALSNCTAIQSVILPRADCVMDGETPLTIAAGLFNYENGIAEMDGFDKTGEHMGAFSYYAPYSLKTIIIRGGEAIPAYSFYGMKNLVEITIPETITEIGNYAFDGCDSLGIVHLQVEPGKWNDMKENGKIGDHNDPLWRALRRGDFTNDGEIDISDVIALKRMCAEDTTITYTAEGLKYADCNLDGRITAEDAAIILRIIARLE